MSTNQPPRVKIAIPTFNRAEVLREAIQSVLNQTFGDFALEISDNASTDHTPAVVASFDDPRIMYRRSPENVGLLGNYNSFLTGSGDTSEYLVILSDDDLLYPRFLETAVQALEEHPRAGMVHTAFDQIAADGKVVAPGNWTGNLSRTTVEPADDFLRASMKWSCRVCPSTALMRSVAIPPEGLRAEEFPASDFGLWLRMAAAGWDSIFVAERLAAYRLHTQAESARLFGLAQTDRYSFDLETVRRIAGLKLAFLGEHRSRTDIDDLRRLLQWGTNFGILSTLRQTTLERWGVRFPRAHFIAAAAAVDRKLLLNDLLWRYVVADLLEPVRRPRATLRRALGRSREDVLSPPAVPLEPGKPTPGRPLCVHACRRGRRPR